MSKVKITGHASGSGTLTLTGPNTSSDRTITLPDATGTLLNSDGSAASLTAIPAANVTGNLPSANYIPRATPLIINGDMKVYQRGSVDLTDNSALYTLDRWRGFMRGGPLCTATQDSDVPTTGGFANSWKIDVTTGDALTGAANDLALLSYTFEGQDLQHWKKGTADAETITVAFWIKSTVTGTYILELYDGDNTRTCNIAYTVSSADTWEHKVVNFPADTTGAFNDDETLALYLQWYLGAGTQYTGGTLSTTWASISGDSTNRAEGQVNAVNSASNNIYITGVQVEVGTYTSATLPPFQHENYGDNLARCQRYYSRLDSSGTGYNAVASGVVRSSSACSVNVDYPATMRTTPSFTMSGSWIAEPSGGGQAITAGTPYLANSSMLWQPAGLSGATTGTGVIVHASADANAYLAWDSEL